MTPWQRAGRARPRFLRPYELAAALEFCHAAGPDGVLAGARIQELATKTITQGEVLVVPRAGGGNGGGGGGRAGGWTGGWLSGEIARRQQIEALCWCGSALMVVGGEPDRGEEYGAAFARVLRPRGRRYGSIVGAADVVLPLWQGLEGEWGRPRTLRPVQLLMSTTEPASLPGDPAVRPAGPADLDLVAPAAWAMFSEELGFPPGGPAGAHRSYVAKLIEQGNTYVRLGAGAGGAARVEFKADLGAVFGGWAQVHGVWVDPACRGHGLATQGMAAVVHQGLARGLRGLSLYVNDFNTAAVAAYRHVGFDVVGRWATVML